MDIQTYYIHAAPLHKGVFFHVVNFTDLSTDSDGSIVEWHWDFGDGTNETITTPPANTTHQYAAIGTYTVTLTVTDNEGATNNISKDIIVGVTLAEALDNAELNWTTGGDTKWFGQTGNIHIRQ